MPQIGPPHGPQKSNSHIHIERRFKGSRSVLANKSSSGALKRCSLFVVTMRGRPVTVALLYLLPSPVLCESPVLTGREVHNGCRNFISNTNNNLFYQGVCTAIVDDVAYYSWALTDELKICPPRGTTLGQATRMVVNYMDAHPERLNEDFRIIAIDALRAAWPCRTP